MMIDAVDGRIGRLMVMLMVMWFGVMVGVKRLTRSVFVCLARDTADGSQAK